MEQVPIGLVDVVEAECELHHVWRHLDHELVRIARDPRVLANEAYARREATGPVAYAELLATPRVARFWVFDGVHRAIQLVRRGESDISLCVGWPEG